MAPAVRTASSGRKLADEPAVACTVARQPTRRWSDITTPTRETNDDAADLTPVGAATTLPTYVRQIWGRRQLARLLARSDLRAKNQDSTLGNLWHLLDPMLLAGVFYVVFGVVLGARRGVDNYAAFLVCGVFTFRFTSKTMMAGAKSMTGNLALLRSLAFPRATLPVSSVLQETATQGYAFIAMLALVAATGVEPSFTWLWLPAIVCLQGVFNLGAGLALARMSHHMRDIQQLLPYLIRLWLYTSGVFFPLAFVMERADGLLLTLWIANPLHQYMQLVRDAVLGEPVSVSLWVGAACWAIASLTVGLWLFHDREQEYSRG